MKLLKKCIVALLVVTSVFCVAPMFNNTVEAASTKKVSTKYNYSKLSNQKNYDKIPSVKKGKTIVTMKKSNAYVKFTATKTKNYKIKISNVKKPSAKSVNGYIAFYTLNTSSYGYKSLKSKKVKTYGGKTDTLKLANKNFLNGWPNSGKKKTWYKKDRTAEVKLKKGQSIYFGGYFAGSSSEKATYTVEIK